MFILWRFQLKSGSPNGTNAQSKMTGFQGDNTRIKKLKVLPSAQKKENLGKSARLCLQIPTLVNRTDYSTEIEPG